MADAAMLRGIRAGDAVDAQQAEALDLGVVGLPLEDIAVSRELLGDLLEPRSAREVALVLVDLAESPNLVRRVRAAPVVLDDDADPVLQLALQAVDRCDANRVGKLLEDRLVPEPSVVAVAEAARPDPRRAVRDCPAEGGLPDDSLALGRRLLPRIGDLGLPLREVLELPMAGFQVSPYGRFWVSPEGRTAQRDRIV